MNKKYPLVFFILLFHFAYSQNNFKIQIDSLLSVLKDNKEDSSKVTIYHAICKKYYQRDIDKLIFYNNKIIAISEKINYEKGIGLYYYNCILINTIKSENPIPNALKASAIFLKLNDIDNYISSQYYLAFGYMVKDEYYKSKAVINKTLQVSLKNSKNKSSGDLYSLLGLIFYYEESLDFALNNYKEALFYYEKNVNSIEVKSSVYEKMAFIYTDMEEYKESLRYLKLAEINEINVVINIEKAIVYNKLNLYKEAKKILLKNKKISTGKSKDIDEYNTFTLAETYYNMKNYNLALSNLENIIPEKIVYTIKNIDNKIAHLDLMAKCYSKLNNLKKAERYSKEAIFLIDSAGLEYSKFEVFLNKSEIDEKVGNFKAALLYYKKYATLQKEKYIKIKNQRVKELQIDFDVTEKNSKIKSLKLNQLKKSIQISKQKNYILVISFSLFLALLSIFFIFKIHRSTIRKNKLIAIKNSKLKNAQLLTQKSLAEKEILLKEIHHRVKNNMQLVMSLLKIQAKDVKNTSVEDFLKISQSRINSMALIHENLYQTKNSTASINFKNYIETLINAIKLTYEKIKDVDVNYAITESTIDIQTAIPLGLIINEIINNSYKHAFNNVTNPSIKIAFSKKNSTSVIEISDNGLGIKDEELSEKALGLSLIKLLVLQINGEIKIDTKSGTSFQISF